MSDSLEFLLGLLEDANAPHVSWEDFQGPHGKALRLWQRMGFVSCYPGMHPVPSCPHCGKGIPYLLGQHYVCDRCHSAVDRPHLLLWPLHLDTFLGWLSGRLRLRGGVRLIDRRLWQLGTGEEAGIQFECFYYRHGALSEAEKERLTAFVQTVVLFGLTRPPESDHVGLCRSLRGILDLGRALKVAKNLRLLETGRVVRFDPQTGTLWGGSVRLGDVPIGSKQCYFLECLTGVNLDRFVAYADLKRYVQQRSGTADTTEDATFCQKLKSRIKERSVPRIDELIVTSNKGDGYRMKGSW